MQEETIPLNFDTESDSDMEKSGEFDYKNLITIENDEIGCIVCFKTNAEMQETYGCIQCKQCKLCKECALKIRTRTKNKKIKNKCPVCSKTKDWCKNITTNEIFIPIISQTYDIENQQMFIIERRNILRRHRRSCGDMKVIWSILCCMAGSFFCYMFYINDGNMLNRKRENN